MTILAILPSADANWIRFYSSSHVSHSVSLNPTKIIYPTGFRGTYARSNYCAATKTGHLQQIPIEGHIGS